MPCVRVLAIGLLLVTATPTAARADGLLIPFLGVNFGGDSGKELSDAIEASRLNWGVSFGYMGGGVFGIEGDFSYSPDFLGKTDLGGSSAMSLMGNLLLGVPFGGQSGFGVRPYGVIGVGMVRTKVDAFGVLELDNNKAAWNFGGGVMMFFGPVGARADLRYFRTFGALDFLDLDILDRVGSVDFARASAGLVLRF
jgi:opacity protein-like surface antigen